MESRIVWGPREKFVYGIIATTTRPPDMNAHDTTVVQSEETEIQT